MRPWERHPAESDANATRLSPSMTDAEMIRSVQAGDERALSTLYRTYLPTVWRFAYGQLRGDRHAAEDVVAETFLAALEGVGRLSPEGGSVGGWLTGIARHKVADHWRRLGRAAGQVADDDPVDPTDPLQALADRQQRRQVAQAMGSLPDDERLALESKYLDGCPVRDIAERLGRTEKAVEALLYRARHSFRAAFERLQGLRGQE